MGLLSYRSTSTTSGRSGSGVRLCCLGSLAAGVTVLLLAAGGCASPSRANIDLRKRVADLEGQIDDLKRQAAADEATIRGLRERSGVLPTLPEDRLQKLFTVGSIKLTKLTEGANLERQAGPDTGVRAYVRLYDEHGDVIKAAGTFTVEVFDLEAEENRLIAKREFPVGEAEQYWYGIALVYSFALPVPFDRPPTQEQVTVKVTYVDDLTQRVFTSQRTARVKLGSGGAARVTTGPTTNRS